MWSKFINLFKGYYTNDVVVVYGIDFVGYVWGQIVWSKFESHPVGKEVKFTDECFRPAQKLPDGSFEARKTKSFMDK